MMRHVTRRELLACLAVAPLAAAGGLDARIQSFYEQIRRQVEGDAIGGMILGVLVGTRLHWKGACGFANREEKQPMSSELILRIGSITKSFTAVMTMHLLDERILSLEDPVKKYVPEILTLKGGETAWKEAMTLRHLASHTSGLARMPELADPRSGPDREVG